MKSSDHTTSLGCMVRFGKWLGGGGGGGIITLKGAGYFTVHFWGQVTSRQHVRCAACVHGLETFENHFCENLDP